MTRPMVARDVVEAFLAQYRLTLEEHPVIALGLRGALDLGRPNRIGGFDDVLVVLTPRLCEAFVGNTDPSSEIPNRANLVTGIHWFAPGFHHPGTPRQYPAFVQDGPIVVSRWQTEDVLAGTKDERGTCVGGGLWRGEFAIHIHDSMGVNTTGSEGCQTLIKTEWPAFYALLSHELQLANRSRFPYLLVDATSSAAVSTEAAA